MPVNPINVAMLTMAVVNPLVQKHIFCCDTPRGERGVFFTGITCCFCYISCQLDRNLQMITFQLRNVKSTHVLPLQQRSCISIGTGGSVQCGKADLSFVSLTYIFSSIGLIGILFTLFYLSI